MMAALTDKEIDFLQSQHVARIATATAQARPHVVPVALHFDADTGEVAIALHDLPEPRGQNRQYRRNLEANPVLAIVVDDVVSTDPWVAHGIELRGRVEIHPEGGERFGPGAGPVWIELIPTWAASWGIEAPPYEPPFSRSLAIRPVPS